MTKLIAAMALLLQAGGAQDKKPPEAGEGQDVKGVFWQLPAQGEKLELIWQYSLTYGENGIIPKSIKDKRTVAAEIIPVRSKRSGSGFELNIKIVDWTYEEDGVEVEVTKNEKGLEGEISRVEEYGNYAKMMNKLKKPVKSPSEYSKSQMESGERIISFLKSNISADYRVSLSKSYLSISDAAGTKASGSGVVYGLFDDGWIHPHLPPNGLKVGERWSLGVGLRGVNVPYGSTFESEAKKKVNPMICKDKGNAFGASGGLNWRFGDSFKKVSGSHSVNLELEFSKEGYLISSERSIKHSSRKKALESTARCSVTTSARVRKLKE